MVGEASGGFILGVTLTAFFGGMFCFGGGWVFLTGAGCLTGSDSGSGILAEIV